MKKSLIALFIVIISAIGIVGYTQPFDGPNEVIEENNHSTTINS